MIKIGNWLDRCDKQGLAEAAGYNLFRAMYHLDTNPPKYKGWEDVVVAYRLDHITELSHDRGDRHIVVLECADGSINQVLTLEDASETLKIFAGCDLGIFNTDGSAFIQYLKDGVEQAVFHIDNSPYDINEDDMWIELTGCRNDEDFNHEIALHEFRQHLIENGVDINLHKVTSENTIFVTQL